MIQQPTNSSEMNKKVQPAPSTQFSQQASRISVNDLKLKSALRDLASSDDDE